MENNEKYKYLILIINFYSKIITNWEGVYSCGCHTNLKLDYEKETFTMVDRYERG